MKTIIKDEFNEHLNVTKDSIDSILPSIENAAKICISSLKKGGKILLMGNGGSAADAQHFASELVGRYKVDRKGIPAIALTTDTSALTSIGNDYGFDHLFERQIEALATKNDVVIGISTGGTSLNVINALELANRLNCKTIGFSGKDGGQFNLICDENIVVPATNTPRIQEIHIVIYHTICHLIEKSFSKN